jgi:hypothetical protein
MDDYKLFEEIEGGRRIIDDLTSIANALTKASKLHAKQSEALAKSSKLHADQSDQLQQIVRKMKS